MIQECGRNCVIYKYFNSKAVSDAIAFEMKNMEKREKGVPFMVRLSAKQRKALEELKAQGYSEAAVIRLALDKKLSEMSENGMLPKGVFR